MFPPFFAAPVSERFTRWLHEMNPLGLGNIPFHAPIPLCYVWAVSSFTLSPSISCFIPVTLTGYTAELVLFTPWTYIESEQWIELKIKKLDVTFNKVHFSDFLEGPSVGKVRKG